jgi:molybdopterin-guanine dinucleotide biosynthesis protein A
VASAISAVTPVEILAANDDDAAKWLDGVVIAVDKYHHAGGMAGVHSALSLGRDVLVVAWDMPFVDAKLLQALVTRAGTGDFTAVVPESRSPIGCEPFCALYATAALPAIESYLASGGGPAHSFLRELPSVSWLPLGEVARFGDPERLFFSVNTAADLDRARAMAEMTQ